MSNMFLTVNALKVVLRICEKSSKMAQNEKKTLSTHHFPGTMVDFGVMSMVHPFYVGMNNVPIGEVNFSLHTVLANIHVFSL